MTTPTLYELTMDIFNIVAERFDNIVGELELIDNAGGRTVDSDGDVLIWNETTRMTIEEPDESYVIDIVPSTNLPNLSYRLTLTYTYPNGTSLGDTINFDMPEEDATLSEILSAEAGSPADGTGLFRNLFDTPDEIEATKFLAGSPDASRIVFVDAPSGTSGGDGLNEAEVDARIHVLRPNDFTNDEKAKLDDIEADAEVNVKSDWNATRGDAEILNKPDFDALQTNIDAKANQSELDSVSEVVNANRLGLATAEADIADVADLQSVTVSTASSYQNTLNSQLGSAHPLWLVINTTISGTRGGSSYNWEAGQVLYFPPTSDTAEPMFVLSQGGMSGVADGSITTAKLADLAVTSEKLGNQAVTDRKIAANSVASGHLKNAVITTDKIVRNAVTGDKIPANAIISGHLAANAVNTEDMANNAVTEAKLASAVRTKLNAEPNLSDYRTSDAQDAIDEAQNTQIGTKADQTDVDAVETRLDNVERDFLFEPNYWVSDATARTFIVHLNSGNVPRGSTRIRLVIGGASKTQNITSGDTDYSFDFTTTDATNIRNNLRGATTISANLEYLDASSSLATQHVLLRVLAEAPAGAGLQVVTSDATLTGQGTTGSELRVTNPFTDADETKLDGIETGAQVNVGQEFTSADETKLDGLPLIVSITQARYDALTKDANTLYIIVG